MDFFYYTSAWAFDYLQSITGNIRGILSAIFITLIFPFALYSQSVHYTLTVLSKKDSTQLAFATVSVNSIDQNNKRSQQFNTDESAMVSYGVDPPFRLTVYKFGYKLKQEVVNADPPKIIYLDPLEVFIDPVTVSTAQIDERPVENSLYKIKVISSKEIELQAATNLRDILNNQLNMQVNTDPILGSNLDMQGLNGQNIKILIDGVPVIGRENGNIDLNQINLANVEHIEIIEGPVSTVYGADALGGVINIITKSKSENPFEVNLNSRYESIGTYNFNGSVNVGRHNSDASVFGGRNFFDGYSPDNTSRDQLWNPREQYFGGIGFIHRFENAQLRYKGDMLYEKIYDKGAPVITPYDAYANDNIYQTKRLTNSIFFNKKFNDKGRINSSVSYQIYQRSKFDYYKNLQTLVNTELPDTGGNTTTFNNINLKADYSNFKLKRGNYLLGADINMENGSGAKIPGVKNINDYAALASLEWNPINNLQLRPSARLAYNSAYSTHFIPAFNAKYVFKSNTSIRMSAAKGYRAPSLKELYLDFVDVNHNIHGDADLQPESSVNYQLAIEHTKFFNTCLLRLEPSVFFNDVNNIITLALRNSQTNYYTYINSGKFKNYGFGITGSLQSNSVKFDAGFYNTATYNLLSEYYDLQSYLSTPEYRMALTYSDNKSNISSGLYFKYTGESKAFALDNNSQPYLVQSGSFSFLDWTVSKKFYKAVTITTGIKNILDVKNISSTIVSGSPHADSGDLPVGMGRYFFAEMKWQLFKGCFKK